MIDRRGGFAGVLTTAFIRLPRTRVMFTMSLIYSRGGTSVSHVQSHPPLLAMPFCGLPFHSHCAIKASAEAARDETDRGGQSLIPVRNGATRIDLPDTVLVIEPCRIAHGSRIAVRRIDADAESKP
jgi:hypothetical protein